LDGYLVVMHFPDPVSVLSHDDLLSLGIGRVIRSHSLLEYRLRNAFQFLASFGEEGEVAKGRLGADRLADGCRLRLQRANLDPTVTTAGTGALEAARAANVMRNLIVHDLWVLDSQTDAEQPSPRWNRFTAERGQSRTVGRPTPTDLNALEDTRSALDRAALRISGLFMALHEVLPGPDQTRHMTGRPRSMPTYLALMNDEFRLEANGDWEITASD